MTDVSDAVIEPVTNADGPEMDALIALYRDAIPARERKPDPEVRAMARSSSHRVEIARVGADTVGFLLLYRGASVSLLEYLATVEQVRGGGLGGRLYRRARELADPLPLVVEVESDDAAGPDQTLRRRRIAFYRRLGCREVEGFDFILPLAGDGAPPPLKLLVDCPAEAVVTRADLSAWLREIYVEVYGTAADDPRLLAMTRALRTEPRLI